MVPEKTEAMKQMEKMLGIEPEPEPVVSDETKNAIEEIKKDTDYLVESNSESIAISQARFDRVDYYRKKGYPTEAIGHIEHLLDELVHAQRWIKDLKEEHRELRKRIVEQRKTIEALNDVAGSQQEHIEELEEHQEVINEVISAH